MKFHYGVGWQKGYKVDDGQINLKIPFDPFLIHILCSARLIKLGLCLCKLRINGGKTRSISVCLSFLFHSVNMIPFGFVVLGFCFSFKFS